MTVKMFAECCDHATIVASQQPSSWQCRSGPDRQAIDCAEPRAAGEVSPNRHGRKTFPETATHRPLGSRNIEMHFVAKKDQAVGIRRKVLPGFIVPVNRFSSICLRVFPELLPRRDNGESTLCYRSASSNRTQ